MPSIDVLLCFVLSGGLWYHRLRDVLFNIVSWIPCGYFCSNIGDSGKREKYNDFAYYLSEPLPPFKQHNKPVLILS
jgi:hypothetical protein